MFERKCIECGASLLQDSLFCHLCGAKRKTCSCGAFLDAGMRYCAKCGKLTDEGLLCKEENDKMNQKIAELNKEFEKIKKEEKKIAEEEEKIKQEEENRRAEVEKFAAKLGVETGLTEEEFKYNCIDKGEYIELAYSVCGIKMIAKCDGHWCYNLDFAKQYAKKMTLGGFEDWRVPTIEELKMIWKIQDFCKINIDTYKRVFWSVTLSPKKKWVDSCVYPYHYEKDLYLGLCRGEECNEGGDSLICIR